MASPLDRHLALAGFMGAGKTTLGLEVAERIGRPFHDVDAAVEHGSQHTIAEYVDAFGEEAFRRNEEKETLSALAVDTPHVVALGGGAVTSKAVRDALRTRAITVVLDVDVGTAWERARQSDRPLARDEAQFRRLFEEREPRYREVADAVARDADDVVLAAGRVQLDTGLLERLGELVPGAGPVALVTDAHVAGIYGPDAQLALGGRLGSTHELLPGAHAKTVATAERLWGELRLPRDGTLVAVGGGSLTDVAGFVAATYLRGVDWVAVPTTLTGQVDAGIGGKTAVDLPHGKNLVGVFHWPVRTLVDPALLATLAEPERRAGLAEVVKTSLLAGERLWDLPELELVRRCAAYKTAVCLRDPYERGDRVALNLGHTFAHALETASDYTVSHGDAVALGLLAALRLSGLPTDDVETVLAPRRVAVDRDRARRALARDKKGGRLVLLDEPGKPVVREVSLDAVHAELDRLIAE